MFKVHRIVKGTTVTMLAALTFIMIVWAHGRSAPQPPRGETNSVKAVQLRITFGGHWANVTEIEGGAFTVEREGKKLAITPYIRDEGKVECQALVYFRDSAQRLGATAAQAEDLYPYALALHSYKARLFPQYRDPTCLIPPWSPPPGS